MLPPSRMPSLVATSQQRRVAQALRVLALAAVACLPVPARADLAEIRVERDDVEERGEASVTVHSALPRPRQRTSANGDVRALGMLEYTYGIADRWEAGLQLPVARLDSGWVGTGFDIEVQHVLPHADEGPYWGGRVSLGRTQVPGEPGLYRAELLGIVGYKLQKLHLTLNPGTTVGLSRAATRASPQVSAKLAYRVAATTWAGFELYSDAKDARAEDRRTRLALLALDTRFAGAGVNVGVGRGIADAGFWLAKVIISYELPK